VTHHQIWASAVVVWLIGLFVAWCVGYAARDRHDPTQHRVLVGQLARLRLELDAALDELDHLDHLQWEAHRLSASSPVPVPVAVHVHVAAPLPWAPHHSPMPLHTSRFLDAMPVLPVEEVQS
jgi:hypothetical protein